MKKKEPLISIILPVYNSEMYLAKCLRSICGQTYRNLEILCIDDGSTDGSGEILDEFGKEDERIKIVHQENGGESNARNVGLKMMSGDYIGFMDCDDWIEPQMYEKLVRVIQNEKVDIVASSWYKDTEHDSLKIENEKKVLQEKINREQLLMYIYQRDSYRGFAYMWNKLYVRSLFYEEGELILFPEDLKLGGDVLYLARLAFNAQTAYYLNEGFYHYYQREDSGCHTSNLEKRIDWLEAYRRVIAHAYKIGIDESVIIWIKRFMAYHSSNIAEMAYVQCNSDVLMKCQAIMRQYLEEYIATNQQHLDRIQRFNNILEYNIKE